ncbi:hypothetical protein [Stenotrophomonas virus Jojan60]|nr:hypothetical protein [Stenotrophomonas virus Jojan60]
MGDYTPSTDEVRERPTIALAREIAGWDQGAPGTTRISHWAVNLAAHLLDKGYAHAESVRAEERARIARNIEAEANHDVVRNATLATAARIAREAGR